MDWLDTLFCKLGAGIPSLPSMSQKAPQLGQAAFANMAAQNKFMPTQTPQSASFKPSVVAQMSGPGQAINTTPLNMFQQKGV